jgi:hypothetical protein
MHTCHMDQRSVLHAGKAKTTADQPAAFLLPFPRGLTSQCLKAKTVSVQKLPLSSSIIYAKATVTALATHWLVTSMFIVPKQGVFLGIKL